VFVYNPDTQQLENVIRVGLGPFAMAFDPFTFEDVAANKKVEVQAFRPPVPEPGTLFLLGSGVVCAALWPRRA